MSRAGGAGYLNALRNREYRGLIFAQLTSEFGDQIAAIALSFLVFHRSNSAFYAALTYAVSYIPQILGGAFLGSLADRLPRKGLMMVCDAGRGIAVAAMVLLTANASVPLWTLFVLVLSSAFLAPPFQSARQSLLPEVFADNDDYVAALSFSRVLHQFDQVVGFAVGGLIIALVSPRGALLIDTVTFGASFVYVWLFVVRRPAVAASSRITLPSMAADMVEGMRLVFRDPARRALVLLVSGGLLFVIAPEGLAIAYAAEKQGGARAAGLLTAAGPLGMVAGAWALARFVKPRTQAELLLPLVAACMVPLAATWFSPPLWLAFVLWTITGMFQAFMIPTIAAFNLVTDASARGRANGLAAACVSLAQAVGLALWGAIGYWQGAAHAVALAGIVGIVTVLALWVRWPRAAIRAAWTREPSTPALGGLEPEAAG